MSYSEEVKKYVAMYLEEFGGESGVFDPHDIAGWAYNRGLMRPNLKTIVDILAADISQVFREEYRTDKLGRRYRAKHAVKEKVGKKQIALWADIDDKNAPRAHFVKSFAQRRQMIVGDCVQLKIDIDVYNDKNAKEEPIQAVFDFTDDVKEMTIDFELKKAS
jgi:hypothetical protein